MAAVASVAVAQAAAERHNDQNNEQYQDQHVRLPFIEILQRIPRCACFYAVKLADFVGETWADVFGVAPGELLGAGTRVIADPPGLADYRGLYVLRLGDGCTISAAADIARHVLEGAQNREPDEVFRPEAVRALAGADAGLVLGPSIHAYVDAAAFIHPGPCDARRLGPTDANAIETLRLSVHPDEWAEGGFVHAADDLWGIFEDGVLVAAGNMTDFAGQPADVGLLTRPDARGRGLATQLAGSMTAHALETIPVIRYRALESNLASRSVARRLGFADHRANIAVRLRGG